MTSPRLLRVLALLPIAFQLAACGEDAPERTVLKAPQDESWSYPRFSPDGARVFFTSSPLAPGEPSRMRSVNADGTGLQRENAPHSPVWSADGTRFIFAREGHLYSSPVEGGGPAVLEAEGLGLPHYVDLDVSRDGRWLVFGVHGTSFQGERPGLNLFDWTTREVRLLKERGASPVLSPDGERVAYLHRVSDAGPYELRVLTLTTGEDLGVSLAANDRRPMDWMPDGRLVALTKDGITFFDLSGAAPRATRVINESAPRDLDVSRDGRKMVYGIAGEDDLYVLTGF
ncbi:TolB family protein [Pyxidicoccus sp. 3LFB2]